MMIMTIEVKENEDGSFDISWDENHPTESMFNTWTEKDFIEAIQNHINKISEDEKINGENQ